MKKRAIQQLLDQLKENWPKLNQVKSDTTRHYNSIISDIQERLAEMSIYLKDEIESGIEESVRLKQVHHNTKVLALCVMTKANCGMYTVKCFNQPFYEALLTLMQKLYQFKGVYNVEDTKDCRQILIAGITKSETIKNPQTHEESHVNKGLMPGSIMVTRSPSFASKKSGVLLLKSRIVQVRSQMDVNYKSTPAQIHTIYSSSSSRSETGRHRKSNEFEKETEALFKGIFTNKSSPPKTTTQKKPSTDKIDEKNYFGGMKKGFLNL